MEKPAKIVLTGFPKSGKTAIGRELARLLECPWFDLDGLICAFYRDERGHEPVGEPEFRRLEFVSLDAFLRQYSGADESFVLSLGGGAAADEKCRALLSGRAAGGEGFMIVALVTGRDELYERFSRFGFPRVIDPKRPRESFDRLYDERDAAYRSLAGLVCDSGGAGVEEIADRLCRRIKETLR